MYFQWESISGAAKKPVDRFPRLWAQIKRLGSLFLLTKAQPLKPPLTPFWGFKFLKIPRAFPMGKAYRTEIAINQPYCRNGKADCNRTWQSPRGGQHLLQGWSILAPCQIWTTHAAIYKFRPQDINRERLGRFSPNLVET